MTLGTKRLPQAGEVWRARDGSIVFVYLAAVDPVTSRKHAFSCVQLRPGGPVSFVAGTAYKVFDDGAYRFDRTPIHADLVRFVATFNDLIP